jgi:carbohydrate-selective porin OprB
MFFILPCRLYFVNKIICVVRTYYTIYKLWMIHTPMLWGQVLQYHFLYSQYSQGQASQSHKIEIRYNNHWMGQLKTYIKCEDLTPLLILPINNKNMNL